ncbi:MAG: homoserine kinase [Roseiflexaceae bacterium]
MLQTSEIRTILDAYAIGSPLAIQHARHGSVNETAFVTITGGEQGTQAQVVVRRCTPRLGTAAAQQRHALLAYLHQCGLPVPIMQKRPTGERFLLLNGRVCEIQSFLPGEDVQPGTHSEIDSAARLIGRYHTLVSALPPSVPVDHHHRTTPRYAPQGLRALTEKLFERDIMADLHEDLVWYDTRAAELARHLSDQRYQALPHLLIHGDIHADNMRFCQQQACALLDFDQIGWDTPLTDLVDGLVAFCTAAQTSALWQWGIFRGPLDHHHTTCFLSAYQHIHPLSTEECSVIPLMLETLYLRGCLGRVLATAEAAPDYHQQILEQGRHLAHAVANMQQVFTRHTPPKIAT